MPRYKIVVECHGPCGEAALTYRIGATSPSAAVFHACQIAGEHYPEYTDIQAKRMEVLKNG